MSGSNPVVVEVTRGSAVESIHRGAFAVCDASGTITLAGGDIQRPIYPRSAVKPLQALPLIESGAADALGLGNEELALACSSHGGEPGHARRVGAWLTRMNLTPDHLACGGHPPTHEASTEALYRAGEAVNRLHDNCSGKHTGFLATALHLGEPLEGYHHAHHPVQKRIATVLSEMAGTDVSVLPHGIDGCGIPVLALPLQAMATALARMADPSGLTLARAAACRRILTAMSAEPFLVAGTGRFDTAVMQAVPDIVVKTGAEGVYGAALPKLGLGVALKVDDGAGRAASVLMGALLVRLGAIGEAQADILKDHLEPPILCRDGRTVGVIRAATLLQFTAP